MAFLFELKPQLLQGFSGFWAKYPVRKAKKDALKAWSQVVTSPSVEEQIHQALDWQIPEWASMAWYTPPLPATYLRNERWTDEPTTTKTTANPITAKVIPLMAQQQMDASARIKSLIAAGMDPEEAKQQIYREMGWIK